MIQKIIFVIQFHQMRTLFNCLMNNMRWLFRYSTIGSPPSNGISNLQSENPPSRFTNSRFCRMCKRFDPSNNNESCRDCCSNFRFRKCSFTALRIVGGTSSENGPQSSHPHIPPRILLVPPEAKVMDRRNSSWRVVVVVDCTSAAESFPLVLRLEWDDMPNRLESGCLLNNQFN